MSVILQEEDTVEAEKIKRNNTPSRVVFEGKGLEHFLETLDEYGLAIYNFDKMKGFPENCWFLGEKVKNDTTAV